MNGKYNPKTIEASKKSAPENPLNFAIIALDTYLRSIGYTVNLKPVNGRIMRVIEPRNHG